MPKSNILMVKTKDKRKLFTFQKNLPMLVEFAKMFNAELAIVHSETAEVLDLNKLVPALCDSTYNADHKFEVVQPVLPKENRQREALLMNASQIREYIKKKLLSGKSVSLKDLKTKFGKMGLTDSCLSNHFSQIRKDLEAAGQPLLKTGAGKYILA